ncbi:gag-pol [Trichonephila clavipes]|nr:gag-pol [Trichonephila clavipes]
MRKWFEGAPQQYAVTDLGVGSHTAIDWYNFCREVCIHVLIRDSCKIEGVDVRLLSYFKIENSSIWILSDTRSAIQHLSNWHKMGDNTGVAILEKLKRLLSFREIHQQWFPLYIKIAGNEIADALAKDGAA